MYIEKKFWPDSKRQIFYLTTIANAVPFCSRHALRWKCGHEGPKGREQQLQQLQQRTLQRKPSPLESLGDLKSSSGFFHLFRCCFAVIDSHAKTASAASQERSMGWYSAGKEISVNAIITGSLNIISKAANLRACAYICSSIGNVFSIVNKSLKLRRIEVMPVVKWINSSFLQAAAPSSSSSPWKWGKFVSFNENLMILHESLLGVGCPGSSPPIAF